MAKNEANIRIKAEDQTKSGFESARKNILELTSSVDGFSKISSKGFTGIKESLKSASGSTAILLGALGAAGGALATLKTKIDSLDELDELSQRAGVSAAALLELRTAAQFSGLQNEELQKSLQKLNIQIGEAAIGNKSAIESFKAYGITVKDLYDDNGVLKSADKVLRLIADGNNNIATSSAKALAATSLFGDKLGSAVVPLLNLGATGLQEYADKSMAAKNNTNQAAEAAAKLKDSMDFLKLSFNGLLNGALGPLIIGLADTAKGLQRVKEISGATGIDFINVDDTLRGIKNLEDATKKATKLKKEIAAGKVDIDREKDSATKGFFSKIISDLKRPEFEELNAARESQLAVVQSYINLEVKAEKEKSKTLADNKEKEVAEARAAEKARSEAEAAEKKSELAKKLSEQKAAAAAAARLAQEIATARKEGALSEANNILKIKDANINLEKVNLKKQLDSELITRTDYINKVSELDKARIANKIKVVEAELAQEQKILNGQTSTEPEKIKAANKIKALNTDINALKIASTEIDAVASNNTESRAREIKALILDAKSELESLAGSGVQSVETELNRRFKDVKDDPTVRILIAKKVALAQYSNAQDKVNLISSKYDSERLKASEEFNRGKLTTLEYEDQIIALNAREAKDKQDLIDLAKEYNQTIQDPKITDAITKQQEAVERLKRIQRSASDSINNTIKSGLTDGLTTFINRTKTAGEAFKEFAASVVNDINGLIAKNLAESLFKGIGGDNIGKTLGGIVGLGGAAGEGSSKSGFNLGSIASSLFGGFFAEGGKPPMNKMSIVGEKGPEIFIPDSMGTIIPNKQLGGSTSNVVNINISNTGGARDPQSDQQLAARVGDAVQRAMARNR